MPVTVGQMLDLLNQIAPLELAEEWDNVGLLAGHPDNRVDKVLCALDLSLPVIGEAKALGAGLIVTHHPILFRGRKNLREDDAEGRMLCALVRGNLSMIAMHTNYDNARPGVNDALAAALGLRDVEALEEGMRVGTTDKGDLKAFADFAEARLGGVIRRYGDPETPVERVAVLGGAGEDYASRAMAAGAQAYVTGEMAYHKGVDAAENGLCVLEAGHAATERPGILALSAALQKAADDVQYRVRVFNSKVGLYL
ncbi:MAG: Nif3-like dinuclear metal center hexameric protein [Clostridia bacterium]|nr:Nif3-like dinuclear metal center hexameric protein [Clostridia bacterium]